MNITVFDQQKKLRINKDKIAAIVKAILQGEKIAKAEVSVGFVTRQQIQAFNQRYLKRTYATDVLAFNLSDSPSTLIGDVVVSTDAAFRYASTHNVDVKVEIVLYVVHGILHLLGYDDHTPADTARMRRKEEAVLKKIRPLAVGAVKSAYGNK